MPTHLVGKWKGITIGLALSIAIASAARVAAARNGGSPASGSDSASASSASSETAAAKGAADPNSPIVLELRKLEDTVAAQTKQFDEHSKELDAERAALHDELARIADLEAALGIKPEAAGATAAFAGASPALGPQTSQQPGSQINIVTPENPLSFKIGGADFTPGGFVDLTGIFRSTDVGSGLGTSFTSIPYVTTLPQGRLSELRETSQGSRISLKVDANITKSTAVTGYVESDFNGYVPANANQSTNSDSMRLRLAWAQVRHDKWEFLGGQSWSLLTPTRVGLSPLPGDIFTTLRIDSNYIAGLVYARQTGFRVTYHPTDWWTLGASLENPDQFVPSSVYLPGGSSSIFANQFDSGSSSTYPASTSTNTAIPNLHPDVIVKTAFDWKFGQRAFHLDVAGIVRSFKDYQNVAVPHDTNTLTGGGGSVNLNFEVLHGFHLIGNSFYSDGGGRYIGALGPDVVVRPDGTLSAVHSGSGIGGFEWQTTPNLLIDGYYSGAYFERNYAVTTSTLGTACGVPPTLYCVGFGFPGSANTNNRAYQEATLGFIPTIWSSPNYGKLQLIAQSSYVVRSPWFVAAGGPKNAHVFLTYLDLRYIIP
jgi:hypothetical protein